MHPRRVYRSILAALVLASSILAMAACASSSRGGGRLYVRVGPPAPIVEVLPSRPGADYIWVEGYHRWDGRRYDWVPGYWIRPPRPRAVWVPGHWDHDRQGWFYIDGRWR